MFLDHTQRRTTVGRTPLDEWSAHRRDLYLTTHDTHNRQISTPPVGFEPKISAGERPQAAHLLRSWVRIPPGAWIFVCCECHELEWASSWTEIRKTYINFLVHIIGDHANDANILGRSVHTIMKNKEALAIAGDRIPVQARFSAPVQTGPGAHPASCTMGTGSFPGVKSGRGVTLTPHPLLVSWSRKSRAIPLLPLWAVRPVQSLSACIRVHFTFTFTLPYNIHYKDHYTAR